MKKVFLALAMLALACACNKNEEPVNTDGFTLTGYFDEGARSSFGTPNEASIPYMWSAGDYIWLGSTQSDALAEDTKIAIFEFANGSPAGIGAAHVFYNKTGNSEYATIPAVQSSANDLGANGAFGYAQADKYGSFVLKYKTAYFWFDTKSNNIMTPLTSITVTAAEGLALAGACEFDFNNDAWHASVSNAANQIVLNFGEGVALQSSNQGVFATMTVFPAAIGGKELTIAYTFADGSTFTEVKTPSKDLEMGVVRRISTTIAAENLVPAEPELDYELRVLSFEDDENKKFEPYTLDYQGLEEGYWDIYTWSDLIDTKQQDGDKLYAMAWGGGDQALYWWWDQNNTDLYHAFYDNGYATFAGGGHAISDYTEPEYYGEYLRPYLNKYYTNPSEYWGWQYLQLMTPIGAHSGKNFAVHFGYFDKYSDYQMLSVLPCLEFAETGPHVIDHMYVTCTNYMLNQTIEGVSREDTDSGDQFGGNWDGLDKYDDAWLKIVASGYASKDDTEPCSTSEFYLVNGKEVVLDWRKWDLTELGKVEKVEFNFDYSYQMGGIYGFTIPAYFAYDDVAVRFEK